VQPLAQLAGIVAAHHLWPKYLRRGAIQTAAQALFPVFVRANAVSMSNSNKTASAARESKPLWVSSENRVRREVFELVEGVSESEKKRLKNPMMIPVWLGETGGSSTRGWFRFPFPDGTEFSVLHAGAQG